LVGSSGVGHLIRFVWFLLPMLLVGMEMVGRTMRGVLQKPWLMF
jgi:hypothetical protein